MLQLASDAGVVAAVVNGCSPEDWSLVQKVCSDPPLGMTLVPSYGVHPWSVAEVDEAHPNMAWLKSLRERLEADPAAALGEV